MEQLLTLVGHYSVRVVNRASEIAILWDRHFLKLQFSEIAILWSFNNSFFSIAIKGNKNSLRFEIDNESHIKDEGINGLLGFTMAKSYSVSFNLFLNFTGNWDFLHRIDSPVLMNEFLAE